MQIPVIDATKKELKKQQIHNFMQVTWNPVSKNERKNSKVKSIRTYKDVEEIDVDDKIFMIFVRDWMDITKNFDNEDLYEFMPNFAFLDMGLRFGDINKFRGKNGHKVKGKKVYKLVNNCGLVMLVADDNTAQFFFIKFE